MNEKEFDYSEFSKFADSISNWDTLAMNSAKKAMPDATDYLLSKIPEYPEETLGRLEPPDGVSWLRTDKQRRWFFAAVRNGDLKGWKWVDAQYTITNQRIYSNHQRRTYTYKGEQKDSQGIYKIKQTKELVSPGHPEKIGGARTGNLGRSQGRDIQTQENTVIGIVGFDSTIAPHAPWVIGDDYSEGLDEYQARIHSDRWWQFRVIITDEVPEAWNRFDKTFWENFSRSIENVK